MAAVGEFATFSVSAGLARVQVIDAATEGIAWYFSLPATGPTITKCAIRPGTLTGNSPTYVLSLQALDASGLPDGTILGGASPVSVEITPASGTAGVVTEYTFANAYDTSPGQILALVCRPKAGTTIDGSNNWSFTKDFSTSGHPCVATYADPTWTKANYLPFAALSDGTNWWGWLLNDASSYITTGSDPVYSGIKFTIPAGVADTFTCVGAQIIYWVSGSQTVRLTLYDSADSVLASTDFDTDQIGSGAYLHFDDAPVALTCGSTYRLVLTCTTATCRVYYRDYGSATHRNQAQDWGGISVGTYGTTGSWTDNTARHCQVYPIFSDITEPAAGGSSPRFGDMTGGLR